jgi:autotransporter-associated beta strand protein
MISHPPKFHRSLTGFAAVLGLACATARLAAQTIHQWTGASSTSWTNAANWTNGAIAPTGGVFSVRLNVYNLNNNPLFYTAAEGTTVYSNSVDRGLVVGSGTSVNGTLHISGGTLSTVGAGQTMIGNGTGSTGTVVIAGGQLISPTSAMGNGTGSGNRRSILIMSNGSASLGTVTINTDLATVDLDGGTLTASSISTVGGTARFYFNGGTLAASASPINFLQLGGSTGGGFVRNGGAIVDSAGFTMRFATPLQHSTNLTDNAIDGGLTKNGLGTMTLTGTNTYTGNTTVNGGRLDIEGLLQSPITVQPGAGIGGEGTNSLSLTLAGTNGLYFGPATAGALTVSNLVVLGDKISVLSAGAAVSGTGIVVLTSTDTIVGSPGQFTAPRGTVSFDGTSTKVMIDYAAATLVWKGNDLTNPSFWNTTTTNWDNAGTPDVFVSGDAVIFDDTATTYTVAPQGALSIGALTFSNSANAYTIAGSGISGALPLVLRSGGTVYLAGTNTYSGGTMIESGTLVASNLSSLGTGGITNNGTLNLMAGNGTYSGISTALSGTGVVNVVLGNGAAGMFLAGNNSAFNGILNIGLGAAPGAGKLQITTAAMGTSAVIHVLTNGTFYTTVTSFTNVAPILLDGGDTGEGFGQFRIEGNGKWLGPVTIGGPITSSDDGHVGANFNSVGYILGSIGETNGSQNLIKSAGGVVVFSNANTYSGTTIIRTSGGNAGGIRAAHPLALGATNNGVTIGGGAHLELAGGVTISNELVAISGPGGNNYGALQSFSDSNTWAGPVLIAANQARVGANHSGSILVITGVIDDGTNTYDLITRNNSGYTVLAGANTYKGSTFIYNGLTRLAGGDNRLPIGTRLVIGVSPQACTLDLNGCNQRVAGLSHSGTAADQLLTNSEPSLVTLTVNSSANTTFGGALAGPIHLTKGGTNSLTLTGSNAYSGATTVNAGLLSINKPFLAPTQDVTIASGGVLNLNFTGTNTVDELILGGVLTNQGTWGSSTSGATFVNDTFFTGTGVLLVTNGPAAPAGTAYDTWAAANGLDGTAGKETNFDLDPENDGLASGLEWILGGLPLVRDSGSVLPVETLDGSNFKLDFTRIDESEAETTLLAQWGSTLTGWNDVTIGGTNSGPDANGVVITVLENGASPDDITVSVPRANATNGTLYLRIKATQN